jgi:hypothetical protein
MSHFHLDRPPSYGKLVKKSKKKDSQMRRTSGNSGRLSGVKKSDEDTRARDKAAYSRILHFWRHVDATIGIRDIFASTEAGGSKPLPQLRDRIVGQRRNAGLVCIAIRGREK